jgi:hypothetical protein
MPAADAETACNKLNGYELDGKAFELTRHSPKVAEEEETVVEVVVRSRISIFLLLLFQSGAHPAHFRLWW